VIELKFPPLFELVALKLQHPLLSAISFNDSSLTKLVMIRVVVELFSFVSEFFEFTLDLFALCPFSFALTVANGLSLSFIISLYNLMALLRPRRIFFDSLALVASLALSLM